MSGNAHQRRQHRRHPETVRRTDGPQVITIPLQEFVAESDKPLHTVTFVDDDLPIVNGVEVIGVDEKLAPRLKRKLREVALLTAIVGLIMGAIIYRIYFW